MKMPDFEVWADVLNGESRKDIEIALNDAFSQGRALGHREGYEEGLNTGWAREQDRELAIRESRKQIGGLVASATMKVLGELKTEFTKAEVLLKSERDKELARLGVKLVAHRPPIEQDHGAITPERETRKQQEADAKVMEVVKKVVEQYAVALNNLKDR